MKPEPLSLPATLLLTALALIGLAPAIAHVVGWLP